MQPNGIRHQRTHGCPSTTDLTMNRTVTSLFLLAGGLACLLLAPPARVSAQVEVEVDPMAYAMDGFSLHLARMFGPVRMNVGTFGIRVPEFVHGNEGWTNTMRGVGVKVDHVGSSQAGLFAGIEGGVMRMKYDRAASTSPETRTVVGIGVRAGHRTFIGDRGLYVAPWIGVGYNMNGDPVQVDGAEFERSALSIFPTIHVGWRF